MTAIILGAQGQDGRFLKQLLDGIDNVDVLEVTRKASDGDIDITVYSSVCEIVKKTKPEFIFHLAANSTTDHRFILENQAIISTGTLNILEAVRNFSPLSKVFISGSALQFKNDGSPINETTPFEARDAYSLCRIQSVLTARYYRSLGMKTYVGYFFNHDSPLRSERHMTKKIASAAKRIATGSDEKLEIGDLEAIKEYGYAGDIVNAIWTLVNQDDVYEAVIGSGLGYSIADWLQECFTIAGKNWKDYVVPNENFFSGYKQLVSDPSLIRSLGWSPGVDFKELAKIMMQ
jgi:GDPmannose 4,6-dehydratase